MPCVLSGIGLVEAHIPVQVGTGKAPAGTLRRIESDAIGRHPQIRHAPQLCEGLVDAWRSAVRVEGGMLEILDHDAVLASVPRLRIVQTHAEMIEDGRRRGLARRRRHRLAQHHVAVLVPEREIVRREHRLARLDLGEPLPDVRRIFRPATAALMRAT